MSRRSFVLPNCDDSHPNLCVERGQNGRGVGWWVPQLKHTYLAKWIDGTRAARRDWRNLVLVDPFCGPARIGVEGESSTRPGGCAVAWLQSVKSGVPFTKVLLGDASGERARAAHVRMEALQAPVFTFEGPALETVPQMMANIPRGSLVLAYLDPYNLQFLDFQIIEALASFKAIDFAVHFSLYDLLRNLDLEADPERARFDGAAPGWRTAIDQTTLAQAGLREAFFDYWMQLVLGLGFKFSREMPLLRNNQNAPVYRLACFSRHDLPNRVWADVARNPTRSLFDDFSTP